MTHQADLAMKETDSVSASAIFLYAVAFVAVLSVIFSNNVACLLIGLDGTSWVIAFKAQAARLAFSQLGVDPLQGNFDAYYPALREYFLPEALSLPLTGIDAGKAATYTVYGALMMSTTYWLARSVGFSRAVAFFGGASYAAVMLPTNLAGISWLYPIYNILPHLGQVVSLTAVIVACFWSLDRKRPLVGLALGAIAVASVLISAVSFITMTVLMIPTIAVYGGASIFCSSRRTDIALRVGTAAACVVVPLLLGLAHYIYAIAGYTAYNFFSPEFMQSRASFGFASLLYNPWPIGKLVVVSGFVGASMAAFDERPKVRIFAWTHIAATIVFQIVALSIVVLASGYHGPSPLYFEFMMWPIMLIFIAYAVATVWQRAAVFARWRMVAGSRRADLISRHAPFAAVPLFLVLWSLSVAAIHRSKSCESFAFFPIRPTAITDQLERTIAIGVGKPFRGLAATFDGVPKAGAVDWFAFHAADANLWNATGNDMRLVGLWWYNIPILTQYSPLITPPYYLLLTDFLSKPADKQVRSVLVLTEPNERMLELWGVRFAITDFDPGFGEIKARLPLPGRDDLRLVELGDPNLGGYSPTGVLHAGNFRDGLRLMHEAAFDGRHSVVTDDNLPGSFVAAQDAKLVYQKTGFSLQATSAASSILVLPVQYSRCWSVSGPGDPVLFRANLMQLGIRFTGALDANLTFRFGPLFASQCRIDDIKDMERLDIREARAH
jgi:hypothetical protein